MKVSGLEEWRRLPKIESSIGGSGKATANLWEWILTLTRKKTFTIKVQTASGFATRIRSEYFERRKQVAVGTLCLAITAVGYTIAMDTGANPLQVAGMDKLLPPLKIMMDSWDKDYDPTMKKTSVETDVLELMVQQAKKKGASQKYERVDFLTVVAFFYFLRIWEYAVSGSKNKEKQTTQFRVKDVAFFAKRNGKLRQLSRQRHQKRLGQ